MKNYFKTINILKFLNYNKTTDLPNLDYQAKLFFKQSLNSFYHSNLSEYPKTRNRIDLITIAFNNLNTIKMQFEYLSTNLIDIFSYSVIDNSSKQDISDSIKEYCELNKITYIKLIGNPYNGKDGSKSHGLSLNWAYQHLIKARGAKYFGTLDHDIYPMNKTSILKFLKTTKVWGHYQSRENRWYIWPGFSFFNLQNITTKSFNFLPIEGLDTGGGNWNNIYSNINKEEIHWPIHSYIKYQDGDTVQNTSMELIGDWLHLMNASGWMGGNAKIDISKLINIAKRRINKK